MNVFEKSLRELFDKSQLLQDPKYTGRTCLARLDKDLRVKLSFVENGVAGEYTAIRASIINRTDGVVDKQTFRFRDMVPARSKETLFGRDYPYIWICDGKAEWYGQPLSQKEQRLVRDAILDYVEMYLEPQMSMETQSM
ncbi:MAG: hypothetical protein IJZ39_08105 [Oscillospiraceae bacterium]|nr:hypothetical protein [Oscillospiraceae bacterium]